MIDSSHPSIRSWLRRRLILSCENMMMLKIRRRSLLMTMAFWLPSTFSWFPRQLPQYKSLDFKLSSTPFEADLYSNPYQDDSDRNGYGDGYFPPKSTRLVIGLNKYSHDTSLCAADARTGQVLFGISKERLSRRKHDAGNVATLVESCLESLDLTLDNVDTVVMNNHHHRIRPLEESRSHMEWECGLQINGGMEDGYDDDYNLFPDVMNKHELSHHLAHAYSAAAQCPFDKGMIVVMDGMGETFRTMWNAHINNDSNYTSDLSIADESSWQCVPGDLKERCSGPHSRFDWREAESVYIFNKKEESGLSIRPVFKRFVEEESPPTLYNHGFENMESVGALYSRASSHIFGDWNACGKVMGLAPWIQHSWGSSSSSRSSTRKTSGKNIAIMPTPIESPFMRGKLYADDEDADNKFQVNRTILSGMPCIARNDPDLFDQDQVRKRYDFDDGDDNDVASSSFASDDSYEATATAVATTTTRLPARVALDAIAIAARVQTDLEEVIIDMVRHFKQKTGETNVCLVGGVALNSVLNGRLSRELGFEQTYVPPYPGDDGISVGCCAFGLYGLLQRKIAEESEPGNGNSQRLRRPLWKQPLSPYLGPLYSEYDIQAAIKSAAPWLEVEPMRNEKLRLKTIVEEIASGAVVAWFHGRSEFGPRALGHRSILADPRKKGLVRFINQYVKKRESFRPFAPSVLAEEAKDWFELGTGLNGASNVSPYMSLTASVLPLKRALIPAVTHVDGSSRLQTVTADADPHFYKLISLFRDKTGVPMVLNTSFNTLPGEPIVETPEEAIRSFLCSMGAIEVLVLGDYVIKRKSPNLSKLLGEVTKDGDMKVEPACPKRAGPVTFESTFSLEQGATDDEESVVTTTKVRMPARPMHFEKQGEWFELLDEFEGELLCVCDGTVAFNDMLAQYTATQPEQTRLSPEQLEEETQIIVQNLVHRLVRLFEQTLISW